MRGNKREERLAEGANSVPKEQDTNIPLLANHGPLLVLGAPLNLVTSRASRRLWASLMDFGVAKRAGIHTDYDAFELDLQKFKQPSRPLRPATRA